jgi:hypothetical protein
MLRFLGIRATNKAGAYKHGICSWKQFVCIEALLDLELGLAAAVRER